MRTIVLESDGISSSSYLTDSSTNQQLNDVVRVEFADLSVDSGELWCAILHFCQLGRKDSKDPEQVYIQVTPRKELTS